VPVRANLASARASDEALERLLYPPRRSKYVCERLGGNLAMAGQAITNARNRGGNMIRRDDFPIIVMGLVSCAILLMFGASVIGLI